MAAQNVSVVGIFHRGLNDGLAEREMPPASQWKIEMIWLKNFVPPSQTQQPIKLQNQQPHPPALHSHTHPRTRRVTGQHWQRLHGSSDADRRTNMDTHRDRHGYTASPLLVCRPGSVAWIWMQTSSWHLSMINERLLVKFRRLNEYSLRSWRAYQYLTCLLNMFCIIDAGI